MIEIGPSILAGLQFDPSFFEKHELIPEYFSEGREREIFLEFRRQFNESSKVDAAIASARVQGNGSAAFIGSLQDTVVTFVPGNFPFLVEELRRQYFHRRLLRHVEDLRLKRLDYDEAAARIGKDFEKFNEETASSGPSRTILLSDVQPQEVSWLWKNYFPMGRASLVSGDPDSGKTFFALDMAARISRGQPWADGSPGQEPGNVLYLTVEDQAGDTLRPRLDSLGGDPGRIAILNPECSDFLNFAEKGGLDFFEKESIKHGIRFAVIDPILDFSGGINPNAPEQVRAFLTPIMRIAEKHNFALLLIAHLNKSQTMSAIYRTGGSTQAWLGKCRAAFMIFRDADEKGKRYFQRIKANLSPEDPPQLCFRPIDGRLVFETGAEEVDIEDHLNPQRREEAADSSFAIRWLKTALKDGPLEYRDLRKAAEEAGVGKDALYRARRKLGIIPTTSGFGKFKTSAWELPTR